jgi:Na+/H+ antiporter NhaD/arsenite permease-like protein
VPIDLRQELASVESLADTADAKASKLEGHDRSTIATRVVLLYLVSVLLCFVFVLVIFWAYTPCPPLTQGAPAASVGACLAWKEPADYLLQVLTTAVLPIVTLVLGYYFGTAKNEK